MEWLDVLMEPYVVRAFISAAVVGVSCGILGTFIVLRNMSLIGDALSHAILPGVVMGFVLFGHSLFAFFYGAVLAGFFSVFLITWIQNNVRTRNDAAIGIVFSVMFSIGVVGISAISRNKGVHIDLKDFLFGNVLGVTYEDIILNAFILFMVLISVYLLYQQLLLVSFQEKVAKSMGLSVQYVHYFLMLLLSLVVVSALQSVGVILVVGMLVVPSSTAMLLSSRLPIVLFLSGLHGVVSSLVGILLAVAFESTPGPMIILSGAFFYLIAVIFAPEKGFYFIRRAGKLRQQSMQDEDVLKYLVKKGVGNAVLAASQDLKISSNSVKLSIRRLVKAGFIEKVGAEIVILKAGTKHAYDMIRKHRLWETYMVEKLGYSNDQIHLEAERLEHFMPDEFVDQLEASLGYPRIDPHGSPIPQRKGRLGLKLTDCKEGDVIVVTTEQNIEGMSLKLWKMGLTPNLAFRVSSVNDSEILLRREDKEILIAKAMAFDLDISMVFDERKDKGRG